MQSILTCVLAICLAAITDSAQAQSPNPPSTAKATMVFVDSSPNQGFNFPYWLRLPANHLVGTPTFLLVEPNNSGHVSDKLEDHIAAAKQLAEKAVGADVSKRLNIPLLIPVFPRSKDLYTHCLNRRTLVVQDKLLRRIDLQLLAMCQDARRRLAEQGIVVHEKVLLTGFSASGAFVNRFTCLHPTKVQAVAAGAVNGMLILPMTQLGTDRLPFPIGVDDVDTLTGQAFQLETWKSVPQFIYMGANDTNDAVKFDDAYTSEQRAVIYKLLGEKMQPDRWERCQELYRKAKANVVFKSYQGIGHATNGKLHADIADFFRNAMSAADK